MTKNITPSVLGLGLKFLKTISPGRAFKQFMDSYLYNLQTYMPLSSIEMVKVSDREAVGRIKNCPSLIRMRDLVKKAGLNIDPKFLCEADLKIFPKLAKEFGMDVTIDLEENGCISTAKLK